VTKGQRAAAGVPRRQWLVVVVVAVAAVVVVAVVAVAVVAAAAVVVVVVVVVAVVAVAVAGGSGGGCGDGGTALATHLEADSLVPRHKLRASLASECTVMRAPVCRRHFRALTNIRNVPLAKTFAPHPGCRIFLRANNHALSKRL
jgi:hypothetical protein